MFNGQESLTRQDIYEKNWIVVKTNMLDNSVNVSYADTWEEVSEKATIDLFTERSYYESLNDTAVAAFVLTFTRHLCVNKTCGKEIKTIADIIWTIYRKV